MTIFEPCNSPINKSVGPMVYCCKPACKFFVYHQAAQVLGEVRLHARCDDHWRNTALPDSPFVTEVSEEEFAIWRVMLA